MFESIPIQLSGANSPYAQAVRELVLDQLYIIFNTAAFSVAMYGILVPLFIGMMLAASQQQRQSTIFRFLIVAFVLGTLLFIFVMIMCVMILYGRNVFSSNSLRSYVIGSQFFSYLSCLTLDLCLAAKMRSFFPLSLYSRRFTLLILSPLLLLSIARFVDACIMIAWYAERETQYNLGIFVAYAIEQCLHAISNFYCTVIMLWKAFTLYKRTKGLTGAGTKNARMKFVIQAMTMTFLPSTLVSISLALCTVVMCIRFGQVYFIVLYLGLTQAFIEYFFAVLAIEWSTIHDTRSILNDGKQRDIDSDPEPLKDPQHKSFIDWISEPMEELTTSQYKEEEDGRQA